MSPLRFFSGFEAPVTTNDEEEVFAEDSHLEGNGFDDIIGAIEDIVVGDKFQELQTSILEKYHHHFEVCNMFNGFLQSFTHIIQDSEENKLIYTEIHKFYTTEMETFIETELSQVTILDKIQIQFPLLPESDLLFDQRFLFVICGRQAVIMLECCIDLQDAR